MKSAEVIRLLEQAGWKLDRVSGSHYHFRHPQRPGTVTVPHPKRDIPIGTLWSIWKQAGLPKRR